jgi:hypothetical protein
VHWGAERKRRKALRRATRGCGYALPRDEAVDREIDVLEARVLAECVALRGRVREPEKFRHLRGCATPPPAPAGRRSRKDLRILAAAEEFPPRCRRKKGFVESWHYKDDAPQPTYRREMRLVIRVEDSKHSHIFLL